MAGHWRAIRERQPGLPGTILIMENRVCAVDQCRLPTSRSNRRFTVLTGLLGGVLLLAWSIMAQQFALALPDQDEIRSDINAFQSFFQSRFPGLAIADYQQGVAALPQFAQKQLNRRLLDDFPPYQTPMRGARERWTSPLPSGQSLKDCFSGRPPASAYPYLRDDAVRTVVGDINDCLVANGASALDPGGEEIAELEAAFKEPWSGQVFDIDFRDEAIRAYYEQGRQFFWAKRGQMNLSCANCHVHNAGNQLRGDVLSAALGHGAGYPAYSLGSAPQAGNDGGMMTLHSRYAVCNIMAGAAPFAAQGKEYLALEVYQAIMNSGVPLGVPSVRQ